jgi:Zn-dependent protease
LKHVDPVGTILLPGILLLMRSPFLFGYAKPVPVNFRALRNPRRDIVLVAAAGPAMNIALAVVAALAFHIVGYLPTTIGPWITENLKNGVIINVVLAVFNLFPLPPLDGGRILVGVLPKAVAAPVARLEPYGIAILSRLDSRCLQTARRQLDQHLNCSQSSAGACQNEVVRGESERRSSIVR